jgi:predicted dehydrogenase|tara:strand:- start:759 stop:1736 length:978 start_codon:yes stop_codon:yes gene_type:complete
MNNVLLVGCGNIGSRHLQGLTKTNINLNITICEPSKNSISTAKKRFSEMPINTKVKSLNYLKSINELKENYDLAIIATTSEKRRQLIRDLLNIINIKYFVIEKIAFQSIKDYNEILELFRKKKIKAWVNCPNRLFYSYKKIKNLGSRKSKIILSVDGGNWGLASNLIHYIDLFSYLTSENKLEIDTQHLDNNIYHSKKEGFIELGGTIVIKNIKGDLLIVNDDINSQRPVVLELCYENLRIIISESENKATLQTKKNNWLWKDIVFEITNQSSITNKLLYQIIKMGSCDLISLEKSYQLHKVMIKSFNQHILSVTRKKIDICPIT